MYELLLMNPGKQKAKVSGARQIHRALIHLSFWIFFTVIFFISPPKPLTAELLISWISILTVVAAVVYVNLYVLIPGLYLQKKYLAFFTSLALILVGGAYMIQLITLLEFVRLKMPFSDNLKNLFFFVIISGAFRLYREHERKKRMIETLEKNKLEMELSFLKSQVNPHFLFNTLNNIYATNLNQPETASEMLLKLSEILRFQLEAGQKSLISLEEEIRLIENYISLEKIRALNSQVNFVKEGDFSQLMLPPLILLPLVENAFKYGKNEFEFHISLKNNQFLFEARNQIQSGQRQPLKNKSTGIGHSNVKKRLDLTGVY